MLEKVLDKLNISDNELKGFKIFKTGYSVKVWLFIKDDIKYSVKITLDGKSLGYLFNDITEKDLLYTLFQGRKIIAKDKTRKRIENKIKSILKNTMILD